MLDVIFTTPIQDLGTPYVDGWKIFHPFLNNWGSSIQRSNHDDIFDSSHLDRCLVLFFYRSGCREVGQS